MSNCDECIEADKGCCTTYFLSGWKIILLPAEARRISIFTGKATSEFIDDDVLIPYQLECYSSQGALEDPIWVQLISAWSHPTGIKNFCPFLSKQGCNLPYRVKPFICQIFPLDFNITSGILSIPEQTSCPVGQTARSIEEVLSIFNDDRASLEHAFKTFRLSCIRKLKRLQIQRTEMDAVWGL